MTISCVNRWPTMLAREQTGGLYKHDCTRWLDISDYWLGLWFSQDCLCFMLWCVSLAVIFILAYWQMIATTITKPCYRRDFYPQPANKQIDIITFLNISQHRFLMCLFAFAGTCVPCLLLVFSPLFLVLLIWLQFSLTTMTLADGCGTNENGRKPSPCCRNTKHIK